MSAASWRLRILESVLNDRSLSLLNHAAIVDIPYFWTEGGHEFVIVGNDDYSATPFLNSHSKATKSLPI